MFPALILLSGMFSLFASTSARANLELMLYLAKVIPPAAFASVETAFSQTTRESNTGHILFGAIAALWAATYGMSSAQTILNAIYRTKESRPYWKAKAIAMISTMAIFVLVCSAMLLLVLGDDLAKFLSRRPDVQPSPAGAMESCEICGGHVLHGDGLFHYLSMGPGRQRTPLGGGSPRERSSASSAGWQYRWASGSISTFTIPTRPPMDRSALSLFLLTWFYVSGFMLLLGAEINSTIERAASNPT